MLYRIHGLKLYILNISKLVSQMISSAGAPWLRVAVDVSLPKEPKKHTKDSIDGKTGKLQDHLNHCLKASPFPNSGGLPPLYTTMMPQCRQFGSGPGREQFSLTKTRHDLHDYCNRKTANKYVFCHLMPTKYHVNHCQPTSGITMKCMQRPRLSTWCLETIH